MSEVSETPAPDATVYQIALLPEAWPTVRAFIESVFTSFIVMELPLEAQNADEVEAGIRTYIMALKDA